MALAASLTVPAQAQLLPTITTEPDHLHRQLENLLTSATPASATPGWTVTPAVGLSESWTDHLQQPGGQGKSSFVTTLSPSVLVNGQTARIDTTLLYAPALQHFSGNAAQDRINQTLDATGLLTLVPERVFLDLRGFAAMQPTGGGTGPAGTAVLARQEMSQTTSFSAHPYVRERFGDIGTAELGVALSQTAQYSLATGQSGLPAPSDARTSQSFSSRREYLTLTSGPDLGRTSAELSVSGRQNSGSGVMNGAHRNEGSFTVGYAITRIVTALASLGYQDIRYGGVSPYAYAGPEWNAGLRWTPNADSSITLGYGRHDGANAARLDAVYAPSVRTRIYVRYTDGLASGLEQLLTAVNASTLDPMGNPVERGSLAPLDLGYSFYGVPATLARVSDASVTMVLLLDRDAVSASASRQQRRVLAAAFASTGSEDTTGYYGALAWQREMWPDLQGSAFIQYGRNPGVSGKVVDSLVLSAGLSYVLSETLTATAQYSWTRQVIRQAAGTAFGSAPLPPANLFVVGARKTF